MSLLVFAPIFPETLPRREKGSVTRALLVLTACILVVVATAGAARDPRLEQLELRPADSRLAKQATVQPSDLSPGWKRLRAVANSQQAPDCPGYRPDFSKFTITGQGDSEFSSKDGAASIVSHVEVYATKAHARGDFSLSTLPPVARCLGLMFRREAAKDLSGFTLRVLNSRRVAAPRLGERSAAYRIVIELAQGGTRVKVYIDAVAVLRGRSIGGVFFTGGLEPVAGQWQIVTRMAARLR
jgi:hypothetical protein